MTAAIERTDRTRAALTVLVAEDEALVARDLEVTLHALGYEVAGPVAEAGAALAAAERLQPDLVLMDIRLRGGADGVAAAQTIWERLGIPVIFLTAYSDEDTVSRAQSASPFGFLVKPYLGQQLRPAIEIAVHKHRELRLAAEARAQLEQQRTQFIGGIIRAQEQERSRVARELHDGLAQSLSGLTVRLAALSAGGAAGEWKHELDALRAVCEEMSSDLRRVLHGLHPSVLDDLGLGAALRRAVEDVEAATGLQVELHIGTTTRWEDLPMELNVTIYRIVQEALQNVVRHARARSASVVLERRGDGLRLLVEDDGAGMPAGGEPQRGLGLHSMRERAALLGGTASVESDPGEGTTVVVDLPLRGAMRPGHE